MRIEIDDRSGFCFGVVNAITLAEQAIEGGSSVYSLGDIVHNALEMERLENKGLRITRDPSFNDLRHETVLIRAHGEPPRTYEAAAGKNITIIDATCPVVARLQGMVKDAHKQMSGCGGQVVILGKKGHAEVVGLTGQVEMPTIVIETISDLDEIDYSRPIFLLSQTTQSLDLFERVQAEIRRRCADPTLLTVNDTICRQVANREPHLREFCARFDVIIFVAGRKSSNGRILFTVCRETNPSSYFIEDETELCSEWFDEAAGVGICGATSTPKWIMERVAEKIRTLPNLNNEK